MLLVAGRPHTAGPLAMRGDEIATACGFPRFPRVPRGFLGLLCPLTMGARDAPAGFSALFVSSHTRVVAAVRGPAHASCPSQSTTHERGRSGERQRVSHQGEGVVPVPVPAPVPVPEVERAQVDETAQTEHWAYGHGSAALCQACHATFYFSHAPGQSLPQWS